MESLSVANTKFSFSLFQKISGENRTGNVFYSPVSISTGLAMLSLGARGTTAEQIMKVLSLNECVKPGTTRPITEQPETHHAQKPQIPVMVQCERPMMQQAQTAQMPTNQKLALGQKPEEHVHSSFHKLIAELNKPGVPYLLSHVNRLYGETSYHFVETFLNDVKKYYNAALEPVDFKTKSEAARCNINHWVQTNTKEKIKNILPVRAVDELTRLVLVNAIYFKGVWERQFKKENTSDMQFILNKNQTKPVKMMQQTSQFPLAFIPEVNCRILEMPYDGKHLSMFIILPDRIEDDATGLQKLEKSLNHEKLVEWTRPENMRQGQVKVSLPRFKMEETYDMKKLLISMGMADAFDQMKANFSGMSPSNDLVVSKVVHKSFVEVNEEGTEAAASTGIVVANRCSVPVFNADHPFIFFIRHNTTKSILFYGRFCSP